MGATVLVNELRVVAHVAGGAETPIVKDVSFRIEPGEVLALIGESGSGKTTIGLALMGYARRGCRIVGGSVRIGDTDVLGLSEAGRRQLRGRRVAYIAQSAAASFNPSRTIMDQVVETAHIHSLMPRAEAEKKAVQLFRELALPYPETIGQRYPHQVSGGQLQRLMAAMALMSDPDLVILDEPTTALDVTTQIEVLHAFRRVVRERRTTAVYVTHDLAVVAQMADRILVLRDGAQREIGATAQIISQPQDDYTRSLIAAAKPRPRCAERPSRRRATPLLEVRSLSPVTARWTSTGAGCAGAGRREPEAASRPGASASSANRARARRRWRAWSRASWRRRAGEVAVRRQAAAAAGRTALARRTAPHPDRVPDGGHGAQSGAHDRATSSRGRCSCIVGLRATPLDRRIARAARPGAAAGGVCRAPARRAVRRPEAAREPRARAGGRSRPDPVRRGDFGARHGRGRGHPRSAGATAQGTRRVVHVHQPRPEHRARRVRRHRGAVCGPEGRGDEPRGVQPRAAPPLFPPARHVGARAAARAGWTRSARRAARRCR